MRIFLAAVAALWLSAVFAPALAQSEDDEPAIAIPADAPPDHASPSVCVAVLGRLAEEVSQGRAKADRPRLEAAAKTFREKALPFYDGDEAAMDQTIGSSAAFYDELTIPELETAADLCLAAKDRTFTANE